MSTRKKTCFSCACALFYRCEPAKDKHSTRIFILKLTAVTSSSLMLLCLQPHSQGFSSYQSLERGREFCLVTHPRGAGEQSCHACSWLVLLILSSYSKAQRKLEFQLALGTSSSLRTGCLQTGSLRGWKKFGEQSVNPAAK